MAVTPKAIQDLLDELESSKQSRLRAWSVLQRLAWVLSELGSVAIPPPAQKTFDAESEALEHALAKTLRIRNEAIKTLCSSVRRFRDATIKEECKSDYPHALQALWKALIQAKTVDQVIASLPVIYRACADMKLFTQEVLRVILLDTRYRHISTVEITKGSINESLAHPRDIFRPVIGQSAYAFVLVHNLWAATHKLFMCTEWLCNPTRSLCAFSRYQHWSG